MVSQRISASAGAADEAIQRVGLGHYKGLHINIFYNKLDGNTAQMETRVAGTRRDYCLVYIKHKQMSPPGSMHCPT